MLILKSCQNWLTQNFCDDNNKWLCFQFLCHLGSHIPSSRAVLLCTVCSCAQQMLHCQCLGLLWCIQVLMYVIAHRACMNTTRESALRVDSGRKISWHTGDLNLHQQQHTRPSAQPTELHSCPILNEMSHSHLPQSKKKLLHNEKSDQQRVILICSSLYNIFIQPAQAGSTHAACSVLTNFVIKQGNNSSVV